MNKEKCCDTCFELDQMLVCHTGTVLDSFDNPRNALRSLIDWHLFIERDPRVNADLAAMLAVCEAARAVSYGPQMKWVAVRGLKDAYDALPPSVKEMMDGD